MHKFPELRRFDRERPESNYQKITVAGTAAQGARQRTAVTGPGWRSFSSRPLPVSLLVEDRPDLLLPGPYALSLFASSSAAFAKSTASAAIAAAILVASDAANIADIDSCPEICANASEAAAAAAAADAAALAAASADFPAAVADNSAAAYAAASTALSVASFARRAAFLHSSAVSKAFFAADAECNVSL